jgi:hypothetical protein
MQHRISIPFALSLVLLTASAAEGQQLFNNFPVNGQISAFQVNGGYSFTDSFTLAAGATLGEIEIGAWLNTGDSVTGVTWSIGTAPFGATSGTGVAGATSAYNFSNADGFDVNTVSFAIPSLTLPAGTYYLTLSAAVSAGSYPVYWDINDGAGVDAWDSTYGHVSASNTCFQTIGISGTCAASFEILSTNTAVTALPASITFPNQNVSTTSTAQGITITNNGPGVAAINGIAITGTNPGDFAQTNNCPISPATLAANGSCTIAVTFTPQAANARAAAITITGTSPLSVGLGGTGTLVPSTVTLLPSAVSFPNQILNTTSGSQGITVTNSGPSPLTISSIAVTGTNPGDFAQTNNCPLSPTTIAVNGSCTINVKFTPQAANARSAAITITDNGAGSPQSVSLSATGTAVPTWPNGYNYQATFTVAAGQVPSTQTNFPALISGTYTDFATTANGGRISNTCTQTVGNNATAVPCDLIFTSDAAGTMPLNWEFETYTATTGAVNIWVNAPNLSNGTVIYAWYGQPAVTTLQTTPAATWNSNFMAVYHLKENPAGAAPQLNDSTANGNNASMSGTVLASQQQPGEIDGSVNFEGNTWAAIANPANFSFERTDSFSLSGWFKMNSNSAGTLLAKFPGPGQAGWALLQFNGSSNPTLSLGLFSSGTSNAISGTPAVTTGAWHYVVATYSGTSTVAGMNIYVDGVNQALTSLSNNLTTSIVNTVTPAINGRAGPNSMSSDSMDELRVSAKGVVFSPAYVTATFNNQSHPGTFFTVVTGLTGGGSGSLSPVPAGISFPNQTVNTTSASQGITLTNNGPGAATIDAVAITGTNPGDFAQTNNCPLSPATLAANGVCTINVTFTPAAVSLRSAAITITGSSPQSVGLGGTGTAVPSTVALAPSAVTFANQTVNTTSGAQAITVTNSGPNPLTISSIAVTGTNPGDFAQTNNCPLSPTTIAVNGFCTVNVTFTPTAANARAAAITITDNGASSPQSVGLSGTGTAVPSTVALAPSAVTFANQTVNTTSGAQAITVTNSGPNPLTISSIAVTGTNPGDFAQTNNCPLSPTTIAVNGFCTVNVTFTPTAANARSAAITITDNGVNSPQSVGLSGTGTAVPSTVALAPSAVSFANQTVNTTSGAQAITVTNSGPNPLTISSIAVTGTNPGDFAQTNNCPLSPTTIAVNGFCTVNVTFTPTAANARSAAITITDNGVNSPQSVGLSGTGTAVPSTVALAPSAVSFANQTVNTTSGAQAITVTNSGPNPLTISSIAVTGTNPGDFAQTNNCPLSPTTIAVNGFCTVNVTFTPAAANARSAAITITDNGVNSPQSVGLSGTGTPVPSTVALAPSAVTFANQTVNTTSGAQAITVTNSGPNPLTISSIAVTGTNPGDFAQTNNCPLSPTTIAVNGFCTINVKFTPQAANARSAAITITDNGAGSPQSVGLSGTGIAAVPIWPNGYGYQATFTVAAGEVPSTQTNFPALISGTYTDFATTANGGRISNTCTQTVGNNATTVPCDLIFTSDAAGTMPLNWEFETYTAATGAVNIWVNAPNLSNGTVIYAWYGQPAVTTLQTTPSATWNSNFMAVYHLKENPAGAAPQLNDSTANGNNASMSGTVLASQQQPGEIGGSVNFEGNTWAAIANPANFSFDRTDSFSIAGWFKTASNSAGTLLSKWAGPGNAGWALLQFTGGTSPTFSLGLFDDASNALADTPAVSTGAWHYVVATYSGTSTVAGMNIYVDGVNQALTTLNNSLTTSIVNAATPAINGRAGPNSMSSDSMDELRVSAKGVVFSPAYVTATFNNQSHPGTFFTVVTGLTNP